MDKGQEPRKEKGKLYKIYHTTQFILLFLSLGYRILLEVWSLKGRVKMVQKVEFGNDPAVLLEKKHRKFFFTSFYSSFSFFIGSFKQLLI